MDPLNVHADYLRHIIVKSIKKHDHLGVIEGPMLEKLADMMTDEAIRTIPKWLAMIRSGEITLTPDQLKEFEKYTTPEERETLAFHLSSLVQGLYDRATSKSQS